jgi:hypothetical protein
MNRCLAAMVFLTAVALISPHATAGPAVLFGPGLDASRAAAIAEASLGSSDFTVVGPLASRIGLDDTTAVAIGAPYVTCAEPAERALKGEFLRVDEQMTDMEYRAVRQTIEEIVRRIACYGADASRDDLFTLFFTQGMAAFYEGDTAEAQTAFSRATAIDPSRPWPKDYSATAKPLYDEALRIMTASPPGRVNELVPGDVNVDGGRDYGNPRLYPGGHLVFVPSSTTSMWVTIPRMPALSSDGLIIATAADLQAGLLAGDDRYGPWLSEVAQAEGWTQIALVSADKVVVFRGGSFFTPGGVKIERTTSLRADPPAPAAIAGLVLAGVGAGVAGAGLGLNIRSYNDGIPELGGLLIPVADYDANKRQNTAGLALVFVGAGVAVAGIVVTAIGLAAPKAKLAAVPWIRADQRSVGFGISGRLP